MIVGADFGTTPMGLAQIAARNAQRCCGDPGDCDGPCALAVDERACTCSPNLLAHDIVDIDCPVHGLVAFLRDALRAAA